MVIISSIEELVVIVIMATVVALAVCGNKLLNWGCCCSVDLLEMISLTSGYTFSRSSSIVPHLAVLLEIIVAVD